MGMLSPSVGSPAFTPVKFANCPWPLLSALKYNPTSPTRGSFTRVHSSFCAAPLLSCRLNFPPAPNTPYSMKTKRMTSRGNHRRTLPEVLLIATLVAWTSPSLLAQTVPATDETKKDKDKEETI